MPASKNRNKIKIVDAHIDIADLYKYVGLEASEFFKKESQAAVTLQKLIETNINIAGFSLYYDKSLVKTSFYDGVKSFLKFYETLASETDLLHFIESKKDLQTKRPNQIGYFFAIEGFDCFRSPDDFDEFYEAGVRFFGPTWDNNNEYACGRGGKSDTGFSKAGLEVIRRMNGRKLIADIAHLSEKSVKDLDKHFDGMIVTTHSNVRKVHYTEHSLTDDEIQLVVDREGLVALLPTVNSTGPKGTVEELYRHAEYIAERWGIEYASFTSDIYPIPEYPFIENAKDITLMNKIQDYLLSRLSRREVEKIMYGNWIRILNEAL